MMGLRFEVVRRRVHEHADGRQLWLLRTRCGRPCRRAAEQRDELAAATHSINSSARASNLSGIWRPSALAVVILTGSALVEHKISA